MEEEQWHMIFWKEELLCVLALALLTSIWFAEQPVMAEGKLQKKRKKTRHLTIKQASTVPAQSEARQYIYIKRPLYVYPEQYI